MNFTTYLQSKNHSKTSIEVHKNQLYYFVNWSEKNRIESEFATYNELLGYVKYLQKREVKQRTVKLYINSLNHYYNWLIKEEIIENNPTRNIKIQGVKRKYLYHILEKKELEQLYNNHPIITEANKRNRVILGLLIYQGITTTDLQNLKIEDVKLRECRIIIPRTRRSNQRELKLESLQILGLMEYIMEVRKKLLEITNKKTEQLFISTGTANSLRSVMIKLMQQLKKQNKTVSSLKQIRASVITYWLKNYNLRETQYFAGHRYVSSTESYLVNDLEDLQEDILKFHPI